VKLTGVFVGSIIITKIYSTFISFLHNNKNKNIIIIIIKIIIIINRKILGFIHTLDFFFFTITTSSSPSLSLSNPNPGSSFVPLSLFVFSFGNRIRYMTLFVFNGLNCILISFILFVLLNLTHEV